MPEFWTRHRILAQDIPVHALGWYTISQRIWGRYMMYAPALMRWYTVPQPKTWDSTDGTSHSMPAHDGMSYNIPVHVLGYHIFHPKFRAEVLCTSPGREPVYSEPNSGPWSRVWAIYCCLFASVRFTHFREFRKMGMET